MAEKIALLRFTLVIFRSSTESDKTLQKIENQVDDIIERVINPFYVDVS